MGGMNTTHEHGHGFDRATSAAGTIGGQMSMGFPQTGTASPAVGGADQNNILNYPYSYD